MPPQPGHGPLSSIEQLVDEEQIRDTEGHTSPSIPDDESEQQDTKTRLRLALDDEQDVEGHMPR
jgi:hypothetical protein